MQYSIGRMFALAGLLTLPLGASARADAEQGGSRLERWHPEAFVDPEKPALKIELDAAGLEVTPNEARTADGYTLDEMNIRVERARIGVAVSSLTFAAGAAVASAAGMQSFCFTFGGGTCPPARQTRGLIGLGAAVAALGIFGAIVSGIKLRGHKRERERLMESAHGRPPRVQWDPVQSRFVF